METPSKQVLFLLPSSAGHRLRENGYIDALAEVGIDSVIRRDLEIDHKDVIERLATTFSQRGYDLIIYPDFSSEIFKWERIYQTSFSPKNKDDMDIKAFIQLLEDKGCRLLAESMQLFGQEITFYGKAADFAQRISEKLKKGVDMTNTTGEKKCTRPQQTQYFGSFTSHAEVLQDMRQFQQEVTRTPAAALAFLKRAGLVSASGKPRRLIRG